MAFDSGIDPPRCARHVREEAREESGEWRRVALRYQPPQDCRNIELAQLLMGSARPIVRRFARSALGVDERGERSEFVRLVVLA